MIRITLYMHLIIVFGYWVCFHVFKSQYLTGSLLCLCDLRTVIGTVVVDVCSSVASGLCDSLLLEHLLHLENHCHLGIVLDHFPYPPFLDGACSLICLSIRSHDIT